MQIDWTLYEYEGTVLGRHTQEFQTLRVAWTGGNAVVYSEVAQAVAPQIASFLAREAPEESRIAGWPGAKLVVLPVDGAGEEGNAAMTRAMIRQLKIADYPVEPEPSEKNLLVTGSIAITAQSDGTDLVTVIWRVLEPDGQEIGVVEQSNRVEQGSLERNWNRSASAIAGAAAPGIIDLLEQSAQEGS